MYFVVTGNTLTLLYKSQIEENVEQFCAMAKELGLGGSPLVALTKGLCLG